MTAKVKKKPIEFIYLVGKDELMLRRLGLIIPEFYRLTPYQMKQVKGYVDKSYTKVILLDDRIVPTRAAMAFLPKQKQAKSVAGLYGNTTQTAINLSSVISTKTTYTGLPFHQVTCTWYNNAQGGKITVKYGQEYIVDCYVFCDKYESWQQLLKFIEAFMLLMIYSQCKTVDKYGDTPNRIDQLKRLFFNNRILSLIRELKEEVELTTMPQAIENVLSDLDNLSLTDDDARTSDQRDIKTLLTLIKLDNVVSKFTVDITRPLWDTIEVRYAKKPYMGKFIREIFCHRRQASNIVGFKTLIERQAYNLRIRDFDSDYILGYNLFERLKMNSTAPIYASEVLLRKLPDNHQSRRILRVLGMTKAVIKP